MFSIFVKKHQNYRLSLNSISMDIVVDTEICEFKCAGTHYSSIYEIEKDHR